MTLSIITNFAICNRRTKDIKYIHNFVRVLYYNNKLKIDFKRLNMYIFIWRIFNLLLRGLIKYASIT
jgi:hypothetical protein